MDGYEIVIRDFMQDISGVLPNSVCNTVPLLGYDGMTPGPLIIGRTGVQDTSRFTNAINPKSPYFPPAGPGDRGGEGAPCCHLFAPATRAFPCHSLRCMWPAAVGCANTPMCCNPAASF